MADRKDRDVMARLNDRDFDDPGVRAYLDRLSIETVEYQLGTPEIHTIYAQPAGHWRPGNGRPVLAHEDPAVMQAVGRCAASRVATSIGPSSLSAHAIHPRTCGWCEYPLEQLLAACDWATWYSRFVLAEVYVWRKSEEHRFVTYEREVRADEYDQPAWRDFYAAAAKDRRYRIEQAAA